jgi:predicted AAA+ superfamily ATPase
VLVWATSNRMRLVRETRSEREDELEVDWPRRKSALATRFGRRVRFDAPDQDDYLRIVERLVGRPSAPCRRARPRPPCASPAAPATGPPAHGAPVRRRPPRAP